MNASQATAYALANGAELTIDGRTVNKEREKFALVKPRQSEPAPQVTAITPPRISREMQGLTVVLMNAMQSQRPANGPPPVWDFAVQYGPKGEITTIRATPNQPT